MKFERLFEGLPLVGGHPALDLMNTVEYRGEPEPRDRLRSLDQLLAWCELTGLIDGDESHYLRQLSAKSDGGKSMLQQVVQVREEARKALSAKLLDTVDVQAMTILRRRIEKAARRVRVIIDRSGTGFRREHQINGFDSLVDRIALSVEDVFAIAAREPLRECEGGDCDWLFFDRSRSRHRRWCHPQQCGNTERVRNFRARRTAVVP